MDDFNEEKEQQTEEPSHLGDTRQTNAVVAFLQDPERPLAQRLAPLAILLIVFVTMFSTCGSEEDTGVRTADDIMVFNDSEDSGLGSEATKQEKILAKTQEEEENTFDIDDLDLEEETESDEEFLAIRKARQKSGAIGSTDPKQETPAKPRSPFSSLAKIVPTPTTITEDKDGTVYVADRFRLLSLTDKLEISPKELLDERLFDSTFNEDMSPITAISIADNGAIWLGFERGETARYYRYSWQLYTRMNEPITARINAVKVFGDDFFIATHGLWRWDENYSKAVRADTPNDIRFTTLLPTSNKELYAASNDGVWVYKPEEHEWEIVWKALRTDGVIHTLVERKDGMLLAGTSNGVIELNKRGIVTDRLLAGEVVSEIQETDDGNLFVSTRQHGLFYWNGVRWHRADAKQGLLNTIDSIYIDTTGRFWLLSGRDGLFAAAASHVEEWITKYPETLRGSKLEKPRVFPTACDAAAEILQGIMLSGDIAIEVLDGVSHVFFDGAQVCPKGSGYRRPDGLVVTQEGWRATIFRERARENIDIPKAFAVDKNSTMLLDSRDRIWIGTTDAGLFQYNGKEWLQISDVDFSNNGIRKITEDSRGRIWIASSPSYDKVKKQYLGSPLTLFDGDTVQTFSPRENFGSWFANDIAEVSNRKFLVATKNGFTLLDTNGQMIHFGKRESIKPVFMYSVSLDGGGTAWFGHQFFGDGVSWFDGNTIWNASSKSGLFAERIVETALDRQGRIWLLDASGKVGIYRRDHLQELATAVELPPRKQIKIRP